jgi:hypothetical protein
MDFLLVKGRNKIVDSAAASRGKLRVEHPVSPQAKQTTAGIITQFPHSRLPGKAREGARFGERGRRNAVAFPTAV